MLGKQLLPLWLVGLVIWLLYGQYVCIRIFIGICVWGLYIYTHILIFTSFSKLIYWETSTAWVSNDLQMSLQRHFAVTTLHEHCWKRLNDLKISTHSIRDIVCELILLHESFPAESVMQSELLEEGCMYVIIYKIKSRPCFFPRFFMWLAGLECKYDHQYSACK